MAFVSDSQLLADVLALQQEGNQPFIGSEAQRSRAFVQVVVNGDDVTRFLEPYLISVRVRDSNAFEATLELDDRDARLNIPPIGMGTTLEITYGWRGESQRRVFNGFITDVEHTFGRRSGGRRMHVQGAGWAENTQLKTLNQTEVGKGAPPGLIEGQMHLFSEIANEVAGKAGTSVDIGSTFTNMGRDYWVQNNESALQWFSRMATELGALTRVVDGKFVFYAPGDHNPTSITAKWGVNLIGWRIKPFVHRTLWNAGEQKWFDHKRGEWVIVHHGFNYSTPWVANATAKLPAPANSPSEAEQQVSGFDRNINWQKGEGRIIINGNPNATWMGSVVLTGARPGVDGTYRILTAEHTYDRQGYVTVLEVWPDSLFGGSGAVPQSQQSQPTQPFGSLPAPAPNIQ